MFRAFSEHAATAVGSVWAFVLACAVVVTWALSGRFFHFSDTWQLVINTGTTIVTFLMVFLIQNTQNRDARAIHLKLDELIRSIKGARNEMIDLEGLSDDELQHLQEEFQELGSRGLPGARTTVEVTERELRERERDRQPRRRAAK
ncbi:MAG: low affinity iron permease family protein [Acidobacteria bacterium]|nr:low affinity iron permease family protein [Acidobacteriota bacterium]